MIPTSTLKEIENLLRPEIEKTLIRFDISKKEQGHTLASIMEECVCECLENNGYPISYELDGNGNKKIRSSSDLIFNNHLVNVKFGASKDFGQPNISSLRRMITHLKDTDCDSYYLIKIRVIDDKVHVDFVDILNYPNLINSNTGTGQMMLSESGFYDISDKHNIKKLPKQDKLMYLVELAIRNAKTHITLKQAQLEEMEILHESLGK